MASQPLVLVLLYFIIKVLKLLVDAFAMVVYGPFRLIFELTHLVNVKQPKENNKGAIKHYLSIPIRWTLSILCFPFPFVLLYYIARGIYFISLHFQESGFVRVLSVLATVGAVLALFLRGVYLSKATETYMFSQLSENWFVMQMEMIGFLVSMVGHALLIRIPAFFTDLHKGSPATVTMVCFKHAILSILAVIGIILSPILFITVHRLGHVYRTICTFSPSEVIGTYTGPPKRSQSFGEFLCIQELRAFVELPVLLISFPLVLITGYRAKSFLSQFYKASVDDRLPICVRVISDIIIDIPFALMGIVLCVCVWRWPSIVKYLSIRGTNSLRLTIYQQFFGAIVDIPTVVVASLVLLTGYRVNDAIEGWKLEDKREQEALKKALSTEEKQKVKSDILLNSDVVQVYHKVVFATAVVILLDILATISSLLIVVCVYRIPTLYKKLSTRTQPYSNVVFDEVGNQIIDIPYVLVAIASLWRLPYVIYLTITRDKSAEERRATSVRQFKKALVDIPFTISIVVCVATLLHILSLVSIYFKYKARIKYLKKQQVQKNEKGEKSEPSSADSAPIESEDDIADKYRQGIIRLAMYSPLHLPFIICTYFVVLTVYRVPHVSRIIKKNQHLPGAKKKIAILFVIQAICILLDVVSLLCSLIVFGTVWRAKELWSVLKTETVFVDTLVLKEAVSTHKKILLVFWNLIKDIPLLILIVLSSFAIWRIGYIRQLLRDETDYRKRMIALGLSTLLAILDIPCLLCTLIVLCSWRSKVILSLLAVRWKEGTTIFIHSAVFSQFYQLLLDIPFIILAPLSLWRLYSIITNLFKVDTAAERRRLVLKQFLEMLKDLPYTLATIAVVLSLYRIVNIVKYARGTTKKRKQFGTFRSFIRDQVKQIMIDIPIIVPAAITSTLIPYRLFFLFKALFFITDDKKRRIYLTQTTASTVVDLISIVFAAIIVVTVYRVPVLLWNIYKKGFGSIKKILSGQVNLIIADVTAVIQILTIIYTLFNLYNAACRFIRSYIYAFRKWQKQKSYKALGPKKVVTADNGWILPEEILASAFVYLHPAKLSASSKVCKYWHDVANKNYLWEFYVTHDDVLTAHRNQNETFTGIVYSAFAANHYKQTYIKRHLERTPKKSKTQAQIDYEIGWRGIAHAEFLKTMENIAVFLLEPVQVLAIFTIIPVHLFNLIRSYVFRTRHHTIRPQSLSHTLSKRLLYGYSIELAQACGILLADWKHRIPLRVHIARIMYYGTFLGQTHMYQTSRMVLGIMNLFATWHYVLFGGMILLPFRVTIQPIITEILQYVLPIPWIGMASTFDSLPIADILARHPTAKLVLAPHILVFVLYRRVITWILRIVMYVVTRKLTFYIAWVAFWGQNAVRSYTLCMYRIRDFLPLFGGYHFYAGILGMFARICYNLGILGELILIPITIAWIILPIAIPFYFKIYTSIVPLIIVSGGLLFAARTELKREWRRKTTGKN